ncbi:MAG: Ig-like domain-containing protein, partial [Candidatus Paceibacterota bacterium]
SAHNSSFTSAPTTDLCSSGTATNPITNTTGWSWICTGSTGTAPINCSAKRTVSSVTPACGSAHNSSFTSAPTTDLCSSGTATNPITNTTGWSWICTGSTGTAPINCSAKRTVSSVTPACGSAHNNSFATAPTTDLCSVGTATSLTITINGWTWFCTGSTGTAPKTCSANKVSSTVAPVCGSAHNNSFATAPTTDLCSVGTATEIIINDLGNWSWQCEDNNTEVECFANFKKESHPLNLKIFADLISTSNQLTNSASYKITASLDQDSTIRKIKIKAFSEGVSSVEANIDSFVFGSQGKAWSTILTLPKSASDRNWTIKIISYEYAGELGAVPLTYDYSEAESPKTTIVVPAIKVVSLSTECVIAEYEKDWSVCVNGEQTKKLITSPVGCNTNKEKVIKQFCFEKIGCQYVYSDWSACTNGKKTRTIISKEPNNCNFGSPLVEESCVPEKIISSVESKIVEEPAKTDLEITQKQPEIDPACLQAGINNQADCQIYLYQKNITSECLANNLTTLEKCREYFLNKYGTPLKCTGLESAKCGSLINDVILSYFKTAPITEETRRTLTEEAGKPATINAQTETLIINPLETEIDKQPVQIKIQDVPLSASNGDVSVALVATELKEEQKTLAPVAIVFDDNKNGVPDDIENRLGFVPENRQTVDSSKLTGIDKAIIDGQSIEQPKFNQTIAVSDVLKVAEIKNIELVDTDKNLNKNIRFEGTALPNQIITLYIYSVTPIILTVQADANGNWVYDLDKTLVNGTHEVYVAINDEKGKIIETSLPKPFFIEEALAVSMEEFSGIQDATSIPDQSKMILIFYALAGLICILVFVSLFLLIRQKLGK